MSTSPSYTPLLPILIMALISLTFTLSFISFFLYRFFTKHRRSQKSLTRSPSLRRLADIKLNQRWLEDLNDLSELSELGLVDKNRSSIGIGRAEDANEELEVKIENSKGDVPLVGLAVPARPQSAFISTQARQKLSPRYSRISFFPFPLFNSNDPSSLRVPKIQLRIPSASSNATTLLPQHRRWSQTISRDLRLVLSPVLPSPSRSRAHSNSLLVLSQTGPSPSPSPCVSAPTVAASHPSNFTNGHGYTLETVNRLSAIAEVSESYCTSTSTSTSTSTRSLSQVFAFSQPPTIGTTSTKHTYPCSLASAVVPSSNSVLSTTSSSSSGSNYSVMLAAFPGVPSPPSIPKLSLPPRPSSQTSRPLSNPLALASTTNALSTPLPSQLYTSPEISPSDLIVSENLHELQGQGSLEGIELWLSDKEEMFYYAGVKFDPLSGHGN